MDIRILVLYIYTHMLEAWTYTFPWSFSHISCVSGSFLRVYDVIPWCATYDDMTLLILPLSTVQGFRCLQKRHLHDFNAIHTSVT